MYGMIASMTAERTRSDNERLLALYNRVRTGDELAFRELYEFLSRPLLAYCLSFTRDMDAAKDLFQHTMVQVFEHRHRVRDGNLMGWIFTIARNACRTWETRSQRFVPLDDVMTAHLAAEPFSDADDVTVVQQAILSLSEEFRTVILLRYFGEMSVREIADSEGISESLVKIRLFRARERLSSILSPLIGPES
jgi:RNA polymerase sigma-70 factor (ECF subfamily)